MFRIACPNCGTEGEIGTKCSNCGTMIPNAGLTATFNVRMPDMTMVPYVAPTPKQPRPKWMLPLILVLGFILLCCLIFAATTVLLAPHFFPVPVAREFVEPVLPLVVPGERPNPQPSDLGFSTNPNDYVSSGRAVEVTVDNDGKIWVKLPDGNPTTVTFKTDGFATMWFGQDVYVEYVHAGKQIDNVISLTFRPRNAGWDWTYQEFLNFEANYHEAGGINPACVRDASNGDAPLTSLCQ